jgi:regulatory protein
MIQDNENTCLCTALRLLTHRDHSCEELVRKLRQRGFPSQQIKDSVEECKRLNYLDDERFSDSYIRLLRRKGFGPIRIQEKLRSKGICNDMIQNKLRHQFSKSVQIEQCRFVLQKKLNRTVFASRSDSLKATLYRFLFGRGFYPEVIRQILNEKPLLHSAGFDDLD